MTDALKKAYRKRADLDLELADARQRERTARADVERLTKLYLAADRDVIRLETLAEVKPHD